jgi:hypothetical protein
MARLALKLSDGEAGWMELRVERLTSKPQEVLTARVSFCLGGAAPVHSMTGTTEGWQVAGVYFEALGRSFVRAEEFAKARFPVSYYEDPTSHLPRCTLHHDLDWLHVLLRGLARQDRIALDCFVLDPASGRFSYIGGTCSINDARAFGQELLDELNGL